MECAQLDTGSLKQVMIEHHKALPLFQSQMGSSPVENRRNRTFQNVSKRRQMAAWLVLVSFPDGQPCAQFFCPPKCSRCLTWCGRPPVSSLQLAAGATPLLTPLAQTVGKTTPWHPSCWAVFSRASRRRRRRHQRISSAMPSHADPAFRNASKEASLAQPQGANR